MIVTVVVLCVLAAVIGFFGAAVRSRIRLARAGGFECALRRVPADGRAGGWRHVQAMAVQGRLEVRVMGPGGLWLPARPTSSITVLGARPEPGRRTGWRTGWSVNPRLHVVALQTPDGEQELAVEGSEVQRLLALVTGRPAGGLPTGA